VATDEFLDENPISIPDNVDQFRENLVFKPIAHHVELDFSGEDPQEGVDLNVILSRVLDEPPAFLTNRSVYSLTPEEVGALRKEVESEIDPAFVFNILDILFDILALEKEKEPFQDAINTLSKLLEAFITLGEFQRAADLIKRVYITLKTCELTDWQGDALKEFILNAGDDSQIERIGKILEREERIRLEEVRSFLVLLQANSVKPLVKLLGELKNSKLRRVLCDALAESGKNSIDLFVPFLDDRRWYLARNITYILGRIGKEQAFPYLHKAFNHGEVRVRREAVQSLGLIGGQKANGLLVRALNDPDVRIRCMAAINLGKAGKAAGLIPLLEVVQAREFHKKEGAEIRAFFEAIGMAGSNESIPVLQQLLERKSLFGRRKLDEIRSGAASALAMIGTPEARAVLEIGKDSKDESIREACLQALRGKTPKELMA
jgi:HEAT repeat protein